MTQTSPDFNRQRGGQVDGRSSQQGLVNGRPVPPPPPPRRREPQTASQPEVAVVIQEPEDRLKTSGKFSRPLRQASPQRRKRLVVWWQGLKLRSKTAILAVAVGTLPVLAVGLTAYSLTQKTTTQDLSKIEQSNATGLQDKINAFMRERYGDIQVIASLDVFTDPQLRSQRTSQQKSTLLDQYLKSYGGIYDSIAAFDLQGNPIAQTAGERLGNHADRSYIQAAIKLNGPVISQPILSKSSGELSIYTASIIKDSVTGQPIGVVRARIPVEILDSLLANYATTDHAYYLIDSTGQVFLGAEGRSTGEVVRVTPQTRSDGQPLAITDIFPDLVNRLDANQGAITTTTAQNRLSDTNQLVAFSPPVTYLDLPPLNWSAVVATDAQAAFAAQRRLLVALLLGTSLSAIAATGLALLISRRISRPIESASQAVEKIGQGDLTTRLTIEGQDELADLSTNINQMALQLQEFTQEQQFVSQQAGLLASVTTIQPDLSVDQQVEAINRLLSNTRQFLNVDRVAIYQFQANGSGSVTHEAVAQGLPSAVLQNLSDSCIPEEIRTAYQQDRVLVVNDVAEAELHLEHRALLERLQTKAMISVPIINQNRLFGLLIAHHCQASHTWTAREVDFLRQLGQQMGVLMIVREFSSLAEEQRLLKEKLQRRALELMIQVDPVSQGDLTVRAQVTDDEIGTVADSYNATIESLRRIVSQVQLAVANVTTTASSNTVLVQSLSLASAQQKSEITTAMDRIQAMVDSIQAVVANAEKAEVAVQQATDTVHAGDIAMNRTVDGILSIRETVAETAKKVKRLGESSQRISKVVNLITDFAAQTNLLALNASIEAARAGEEGRGFAVVADEVRSLARQSSEATAEIEALVAEIQAETSDVVMAMETGTEQVVAGTQLVNETRQSLNQITAASEQITQLVTTIAQAAVNQVADSQAVTQTMQDVAEIAQRTSQEAGQVSLAFDELLSVAQTLQGSVGQFKVG